MVEVPFKDYVDMCEKAVWMEQLMALFKTDSPEHAVTSVETILNDFYGGR